MFSALRFNADPSSEKKILPQYDDPEVEEVKAAFLSLFSFL